MSYPEQQLKLKDEKKILAEKVMEHEIDSDTNHSWSTWNNHQEPEKETWRIEKRLRLFDHSTAEIN